MARDRSSGHLVQESVWYPSQNLAHCDELSVTAGKEKEIMVGSINKSCVLTVLV